MEIIYKHNGTLNRIQVDTTWNIMVTGDNVYFDDIYGNPQTIPTKQVVSIGLKRGV